MEIKEKPQTKSSSVTDTKYSRQAFGKYISDLLAIANLRFNAWRVSKLKCATKKNKKQLSRSEKGCFSIKELSVFQNAFIFLSVLVFSTRLTRQNNPASFLPRKSPWRYPTNLAPMSRNPCSRISEAWWLLTWDFLLEKAMDCFKKLNKEHLTFIAKPRLHT